MQNNLIIFDDLHLEHRDEEEKFEFAKKIKSLILESLEEHMNPVVIFAGDIDEGDKAIEWMSQFKNCDMVYVCGNHEYWHNDFYEVEVKIEKKIKELNLERLYFLKNNWVKINDTKFIGTTLWSDLAKSWDWCPKNQLLPNFFEMNDFNHITAKTFYDNPENIKELKVFLNNYDTNEDRINNLIDNKLFNPLIQLSENNKSYNFIKSELEKKVIGEKVVVVTHHLPTGVGWKKEFGFAKNILKSDYINSDEFTSNHKNHIWMMGFYVNNFDDLFLNDNAPTYWFHGHFHNPQDYFVGKTRIVSNPMGHKRHKETPLKLRVKMITMSKGNKHVAQYLKKEIELFDLNTNILNNLRNLEKLIRQMESALGMGVISAQDFKPVVDLIIEKHVQNIELLKTQIVEWFNILLGVTKPNFFSVKNHDDYYVLSKIMNIERATFQGIKYSFPALLNCEVNDYSFLKEEKFEQIKSKVKVKTHYTEWLHDVAKIQIEIINLKKYLMAMMDVHSNI